MASKELEELLKDVKETPIEKTGESQNIRTFLAGQPLHYHVRLMPMDYQLAFSSPAALGPIAWFLS